MRILHWQKTDDSLVRLADGSLRTMADARRLYPDFDLTRTWDLPDIAVEPGDEDLGAYLRRIGFTDDQLEYTRRSYANATGDSLPHISALAALEHMRDETAGAGDYRILDGYDHIINHLADGLDIRLGTIVEWVDWSEERARVHTSAGLFEVERVVITLPLGVLKAGDQGVRFTPELPADKRESIHNLRMGPALKLVYRFDTPVLPRGTLALYSALNPPMWWSPSFGQDTQQTHITAFVTGDYARELLALGEQGALDHGLGTLRAELDLPDLRPVDAHLVNWNTDPFARGGYSVAPPGHAGARAALATPVAGRLYWAGEATAPNAWAATVHGAYASGRRAAADVLADTRLSQP